MNFYNDNDHNACAWMRQLIADRLIPIGGVSCKSIVDITPDEIKPYTQQHFFCGIAGWPKAIDLAGWPRARPIWSASLPCQSFSLAGKGGGFDDHRGKLWEPFFELVKACRPEFVVGEQVEAAIGKGWVDRVCSDLEAEGYTFGFVVLGAHSVNAPHKRQRIYWIAHLPEQRREMHSGRGELHALESVAVEETQEWIRIQKRRQESWEHLHAQAYSGNEEGGRNSGSHKQKQARQQKIELEIGEPIGEQSQPNTLNERSSKATGSEALGGQAIHKQEVSVVGIVSNKRRGDSSQGGGVDGKQLDNTRDGGLAHSAGDRRSGSAEGRQAEEGRKSRSGISGELPKGSEGCGGMGNAGSVRCDERKRGDGSEQGHKGGALGAEPDRSSKPGVLADSQQPGLEGHARDVIGGDQPGRQQEEKAGSAAEGGAWSDFRIIDFDDGKRRKIQREIKPNVVLLDDGFFYTVDTVLAEIITQAMSEIESYAKKSRTSPEEVLRAVRERISSQAIQPINQETLGEIRGVGSFQTSSILQHPMWSVLAARSQSTVDSCSQPEKDSPSHRTMLRDLRTQVEAICSSLRRESNEQCEGQSSDALLILSQFLARCCKASDAISMRSNASSFPIIGKIEGRRKMLHGFGNSIVLPLAVEFVKAVMEEFSISPEQNQ